MPNGFNAGMFTNWKTVQGNWEDYKTSLRRLDQLSHATLEERRWKDDENWEDYKMNGLYTEWKAWSGSETVIVYNEYRK